MKKVESFELDHRIVVAPYVRKCCVLEGEKGVKVSKFDLRFIQPNKDSITTGALHGLEHLLATYLRNYIEGVIDLSPMGCRTGFYLILWGDRDPAEVKDGLEKALKDVLESTEIPARNEIQCGNYKDLSLFGAKEYARQCLEQGFSLNIYGKDK